MANMGDVAMTQVAVRRCRELWPSSTIYVYASDRAALEKHCPDVEHMPFFWPRVSLLQTSSVMGRLTEIIWSRQLLENTLFLELLKRSIKAAASSAYLAWLNVDAVVVAGGGFLNDTFSYFAKWLLTDLVMQIYQGKHVAMFGQGLGPLSQRVLTVASEFVFPKLSILALREALSGNLLAKRFGVASHQLRITGDDAIEVAYERKSHQLGRHLGVNIRVSSYSEISDRDLEVLSEVVGDFCRKRDIQTRALPISKYECDRENARISQVFRSPLLPEEFYDTPADVISQTSNCRIVLAGSYHAAVFALSLGLPAIGLAKSKYYITKFKGLAAAFGPGCTWIDLSVSDWPEKLRNELDRAWEQAGCHRPYLLSRAEEQVRLSREAYAAFAQAISSTNG